MGLQPRHPRRPHRCQRHRRSQHGADPRRHVVRARLLPQHRRRRPHLRCGHRHDIPQRRHQWRQRHYLHDPPQIHQNLPRHSGHHCRRHHHPLHPCRLWRHSSAHLLHHYHLYRRQGNRPCCRWHQELQDRLHRHRQARPGQGVHPPRAQPWWHLHYRRGPLQRHRAQDNLCHHGACRLRQTPFQPPQPRPHCLCQRHRQCRDHG